MSTRIKESIALYIFCLVVVLIGVFGLFYFTAAGGVWWSALIMTVGSVFLPQGGIAVLAGAWVLYSLWFE